MFINEASHTVVFRSDSIFSEKRETYSDSFFSSACNEKNFGVRNLLLERFGASPSSVARSPVL